jgi:hypothetical protein
MLHFSNYSWVFGRLDSPGLSGSDPSLCPGPNGSDRLISVSHCKRLFAVGDHLLPPVRLGRPDAVIDRPATVAGQHREHFDPDDLYWAMVDAHRRQ